MNKPEHHLADHGAPEQKLLDKQDILQLLHISERTLQTWRTKGLLPFYKILGKIYYKYDDLMTMLAQHRYVGKKKS